MQLRARRRLGALLVGGAMLVAVGVAPAPALAGAAATLNVTIGSPQVFGVAGSAANEVTLRQKRDGKVIKTRSFTTSSGGFYDVQLLPIRIGDRIVVTFQGKRTLIIPKVTIRGNAATNVISGHLPEPGDAAITVSDGVGTYTTGQDNLSIPTESDGDFTGSLPRLMGSDTVAVRWENGLGDSVTASRTLTAAEVEVGSAKAWIFGKRGSTVTAELLAPNGNVRGTARVAIPAAYGSARGTFRSGGTAVKVKTGDRVRIGGKVGLKVGTPDMAASPIGLFGSCFPNQDWLAASEFSGGALSYLADGTAAPNGIVSGIWVGPLDSGAKVRVLCENAKGFVQDKVAFVP